MAGSVSSYSSPYLVLAPFGFTTGPDGAMWFTNNDSIGHITTADSVVAAPDQGTSSSSVTISGAGFSAGETIVVKYMTGLSSPASVPLCSTTAGTTGTFTRTTNVPSTAGKPGVHNIKATGKTSKTTVSSTYLLTG
jgi:virginiamycin B lyase